MDELIRFYCDKCDGNFYIEKEDQPYVSYCPFCKNHGVIDKSNK